MNKQILDLLNQINSTAVTDHQKITTLLLEASKLSSVPKRTLNVRQQIEGLLNLNAPAAIKSYLHSTLIQLGYCGLSENTQQYSVLAQEFEKYEDTPYTRLMVVLFTIAHHKVTRIGVDNDI